MRAPLWSPARLTGACCSVPYLPARRAWPSCAPAASPAGLPPPLQTRHCISGRSAKLWQCNQAAALLSFTHTHPPAASTSGSARGGSSSGGSGRAGSGGAAVAAAYPGEVRSAQFAYLDQVLLLASGSKLQAYTYTLVDQEQQDDIARCVASGQLLGAGRAAAAACCGCYIACWTWDSRASQGKKELVRCLPTSWTFNKALLCTMCLPQAAGAQQLPTGRRLCISSPEHHRRQHPEQLPVHAGHLLRQQPQHRAV